MLRISDNPQKEKTNTKVATDIKKSITKTPAIKLVDDPYIASEKDAP